MIRRLLSSVAAFSPPDDQGSSGAPELPLGDVGSGAGETDNSAGDTGGSTETPVIADTKPRKETISESIRRAVKETKDKADSASGTPKTPKSTQTDGAVTSDKTAKPDSDPTKPGNTETPPQGKSGAPQAWKAEEKALWDSLPDGAKAAITRREADTAKGVQELRNRYTEIDTAIAPYSAVMTQNKVTPGQAINQLFKWHMELAGPNKVEAFKTLAKNFGIDPATLAAASSQAAQPGADSSTAIPENLKPIISGLETRIKGFEEQNAAQMNNAAKQTWANWSKDKTHAEKVRGLMANLINSDLALIQAGQPQASNTINSSGSIDMDAAYQAAIYAHPEVRAIVMQEEQKARDKAAKDAADKAKKAGASMRSGAPAGAVVNGGKQAPKNETVRDSITRALAEVRGTQH